MSNHRNNQIAFGCCRGHSDVNAFLEDDAITIHRGIDTRELAQRFCHCLDKKGRKSEPLPRLRLELFLVFVAPIHDSRHIGFYK